MTETFKEFKSFVEKQTDCQIKRVRFNNGGEYINNELKNFFRQEGIKLEPTIPYTPEMNGVSERLNRTLVEKALTMIQDAALNKKYWGEAVNTAIYLKNHSPTKAVWNKTPEEAWTGRKVDLQHLKVFGSRAFLHIPKQLRKKWDPKSRELIMVGYCEDYSSGYRLIDPQKPKRIITGRNVEFIESLGTEKKHPTAASSEKKLEDESNQDESIKIQITESVTGNNSNPTLPENNNQIGSLEPVEVNDTDDDDWETPTADDPSTQQRPKRTTKLSSRLKDMILLHMPRIEEILEDNPQTIKDIRKLDQTEQDN